LLQRRRLRASQLVDIDSLDDIPDERDRLAQSEDRRTVENVLRVIDRLKPLDRQLMLLYLEGVDGAEIAQIVGLSATNVGVRIHRIKQALRERFDAGDKR
jgi:RNA polymerase sigma-70 factor (ECF subfamily)